VIIARAGPYRRRFFASTTLRSPGGFGIGSGRGGGGELREYRLEAADARRQREGVALDRLARQLDQRGLVVIAQIGRHCEIMRRNRSDGESRPMTVGSALAARVRLIVWCKTCRHQAEPEVADQVERFGADTTVIEWASRLRCSGCNGREVDFVIGGA
jgi:hypothetical protein